MRILVVDVAAEHSGAVSILNQFIDEFVNDNKNEYYVILSKLNYPDSANVHFIKCGWVKKSYFHRMYFDNIFMRKLIQQIKPNKVLSLQNKTVWSGDVEQSVYFHNALLISEKHFRFTESRILWLYQNIIGKLTRISLRRASSIIVQADWIKSRLSKAWKIDESIITVKRPKTDFAKFYVPKGRSDSVGCHLFYPANGSIYKNHSALLKACVRIWDSEGMDCGLTLSITAKTDSLCKDSAALLCGKDYPVISTGPLNIEQMSQMYNSKILVFPSYLETIGLPLMEAQLFQSIILAADCEYAHESIGNYSRVMYFDPFNIDSIEKSIRKVLFGE